ncbi:exportin-5-like isoform X2 [Zootermopsis nevadensis]|nr:exportin-5-like isoform X2 [Zootermopsis nevadensis]XP_021913045.1 exportin-5-like isoform X2 [Zootermopsis nevadensis]XP_021913046.1 exportin-5-like isoform X2 [Zootermopsis nevadensis]XP_021913047.1 exportin-5-like isoform X2 [Zootermopsis nevadensis]
MADIAQVAEELARAVELTMDPCVPQQKRVEAYVACERFKETSPVCVQCGLYLAQQNNASHFVRHFGLQLMEHCVKYRWNQISQQEKLFIKENAMKLLERDIEPQFQEHTHIKDALSRIIVEMVKREWPQQWPTLLVELQAACTRGGSQTELVLFVFLRLAEDVALLQTVESNQRRRDIYQALTTNMGEIFAFFLRLVSEHFHAVKKLREQGQEAELNVHVRVVQVVLLTLTGFIEWVSINHIMASDGQLLQMLCLLLGDENFQAAAAECLLQVTYSSCIFGTSNVTFLHSMAP